ncbi:MAG: pantoate--beta-alanine ligase [Dehalococcoidales bacterium]|jgi:pantoate--beta-alanine ligase|nr:pantoate--beta-alanine ligase [Dehalococcoidales bacterium]
MKIIKTISEMRELRKTLPEPVGFVATMGYLHEGHISLVRKAKEENASVMVSIFVNPTQFGPNEDFEKYPRDIDGDLEILEEEGVDAVFAPEADEIYPKDFNSRVEVIGITQKLEGNCRPGHFRGVTTIVNKLFNIVTPNKAYFGQKDAQQAIVINKMVKDLNMNLEVITCPTIREPDGLAMSSRNVYLRPEDRQSATVLYRALMLAKDLYQQGERNAETVRTEMVRLIKTEEPARIDYVSVADPVTLDELDEISGKALVSLAVKFYKTRLIDNIVLG